MEEFLAFGPDDAAAAPAPAAAGSKRRRSSSPEVAVRAGSRAMSSSLAALELPPATAIPWQSPVAGAHKSLPGSCALLRLHEEVLDFARFMSPTVAEQEYADGALTRITDAIRHLYPDARIEVFGSRANGLVLPTSDWDVVLFGVPSGSFTMYRIASEVDRRGLSSKTEVIDSARIPIVKVGSSPAFGAELRPRTDLPPCHLAGPRPDVGDHGRYLLRGRVGPRDARAHQRPHHALPGRAPPRHGSQVLPHPGAGVCVGLIS